MDQLQFFLPYESYSSSPAPYIHLQYSDIMLIHRLAFNVWINPISSNIQQRAENNDLRCSESREFSTNYLWITKKNFIFLRDVRIWQLGKNHTDTYKEHNKAKKQ